MEIVDFIILSLRMMGVNIENLFGKVIMYNVIIVNIRFGDGFVYLCIVVDLCFVFLWKIYFLLFVNVVVKVLMIRCS